LRLVGLMECGAKRWGAFPFKPVVVVGVVRAAVFVGRVKFDPNGLVARGAALACLTQEAVAGLIALRQDIVALEVCCGYELGALMLGRRDISLQQETGDVLEFDVVGSAVALYI
jgi:hypothetical protein